MSNSPRNIAIDGLWRHNPDFSRLLGLSPLLIASDSVINALVLGVATLLMLTVSAPLLLAMLGRDRNPVNSLPGLAMIFAALAACLSLLLQAYAIASWQQLALFLPLVVTNCLVLPRNNVTPWTAMLDGFLTGLGCALLLLAIGALREWLGTTLPLVMQPPGALLLLGLLLAAKNVIDRKSTKPPATEPIEVGSKRVRVTGKI